jgi:hypothetical protein
VNPGFGRLFHRLIRHQRNVLIISNHFCIFTIQQIIIGAWLSPARALGSGPRGRWFKSSRPDKQNAVDTDSVSCFIRHSTSFRFCWFSAVISLVPHLTALIHLLADLLRRSKIQSPRLWFNIRQNCPIEV